MPFWETVLDKSPEEMKSQVMMAAHFAKVNVAFLSKKPAEVNTSHVPLFLSAPYGVISEPLCSDVGVYTSTTRHRGADITAYRVPAFRGSSRPHHPARRASRRGGSP